MPAFSTTTTIGLEIKSDASYSVKIFEKEPDETIEDLIARINEFLKEKLL